MNAKAATFYCIAFAAWICLILHFRSAELALALLCATFGLFWYTRSVQVAQGSDDPNPPMWWITNYMVPVAVAWLTCFVLIGCAFNYYIGGLVLAYELGLLTFFGLLFLLNQ